MVIHVNSVVAPSIALFRCLMYVIYTIIRVNMIRIVLLLPFFNNLYCMYNEVTVVVEIGFN